MFPSMIARAVTLDVISSGMGGTRNGALQVVCLISLLCLLNFAIFRLELIKINYALQMHAEVQLPSPLVPVRQMSFLRFCKQHAEGVWAVVDVALDIGRNTTDANKFMSCKRLPSGCVVQDTPNGFCKVSASCLPCQGFNILKKIFWVFFL